MTKKLNPLDPASAAHKALLGRRHILVFTMGFRNSVTLFEHIEAAIMPPGIDRTSWKHIAARDAALNVYNFAKSLDKLRAVIGLSDIEHDPLRLKKASLDLKSAFPDCYKMRSVVAHGDFERTNMTVQSMSEVIASRARPGIVSVFGAEGGMLEGLCGTTYFVAGDRDEVFQLDVTQASADALNDVFTEAHAAFAKR